MHHHQQQQIKGPPLRPAAALLLLVVLLSLSAATLASAFVVVSPPPSGRSSSSRAVGRIIPRQQQQQQPQQRQQKWAPVLCSSSLKEGGEESPAAAAAGEGATVAAAEQQQQQREAAALRLREELEKEKAQATAMQELKDELAAGKRRNVFTAVGSVVAAVALFFYQHLHPVEAVTLLRQMQSESPVLQQVVGQNGRPTVVDFYAEWCENCKEMAPVLRSIEGRYKDKVNFVVVNGDTTQSADLVDRFRVDGIPHLALITKDGEVKTALIGKVPRSVIEADVEALIRGDAALPYEGYDAFEEEDHFIRF